MTLRYTGRSKPVLCVLGCATEVGQPDANAALPWQCLQFTEPSASPTPPPDLLCPPPPPPSPLSSLLHSVPLHSVQLYLLPPLSYPTCLILLLALYPFFHPLAIFLSPPPPSPLFLIKGKVSREGGEKTVGVYSCTV